MTQPRSTSTPAASPLPADPAKPAASRSMIVGVHAVLLVLTVMVVWATTGRDAGTMADAAVTNRASVDEQRIPSFAQHDTHLTQGSHAAATPAPDARPVARFFHQLGITHPPTRRPTHRTPTTGPSPLRPLRPSPFRPHQGSPAGASPPPPPPPASAGGSPPRRRAAAPRAARRRRCNSSTRSRARRPTPGERRGDDDAPRPRRRNRITQPPSAPLRGHPPDQARAHPRRPRRMVPHRPTRHNPQHETPLTPPGRRPGELATTREPEGVGP